MRTTITYKEASVFFETTYTNKCVVKKNRINYTTFGAPLPGRTWQGGEYRFGFNGQEHDDEVAGVGNIMTAEFWMYDARLGRRWNLDPKPNPSLSSYACFGNNPLFYSDPNGDTLFIRGSNALNDLQGTVSLANSVRLTLGQLTNPEDPNFATFLQINTNGYQAGTDAGLDLLINLVNGNAPDVNGSMVAGQLNVLYASTDNPMGIPTNTNRISQTRTNRPLSYQGGRYEGTQFLTSSLKTGINMAKIIGFANSRQANGDFPEAMVRNGIGVSLGFQVCIHTQTIFGTGNNSLGVPRSLGVFQQLQTAYLNFIDADLVNKNINNHMKQANQIIASPQYQGQRVFERNNPQITRNGSPSFSKISR